MAARHSGSAPSGGPARRTAPLLSPPEFAERLRESFRMLWLVAVGITHDRTLAEDVVQDAALIALEKLHEFEPGSNFRAWMSQTVRFVAYNAARKEGKRRSAAGDGETLMAFPDRRGVHADVDGPALALEGGLHADQAHFDDDVTRALRNVSQVARTCLLLRTVGELDYAEISRVLGIPEGTAMSHVHRTRKTLRDQLSPRRAAAGGDA